MRDKHRMRWILLALLATPLLVQGEGADKSAAQCVDAVQVSLRTAYHALGSPTGIDRKALEAIVEAAKGDLRKLVWGDPDVRVTTNVASDRIRIWVSCGGEELWGDWAPGA